MFYSVYVTASFKQISNKWVPKIVPEDTNNIIGRTCPHIMDTTQVLSLGTRWLKDRNFGHFRCGMLLSAPISTPSDIN